MRKRPVASNRWMWLSIVLCVAAAGCLLWQVWRSDDVVPEAQAPHEQNPAKGDKQVTRFQLAPAEDYREVLARPLFSRDRRESTQTGGEETPLAQISLSGVVLVRGKRVALLRFGGDSKVMHVAEGQQASGWLIESVQPDKVVLRRGELASAVPLDYKRKTDAGAVQVGQSVQAIPQQIPLTGGEAKAKQ